MRYSPEVPDFAIGRCCILYGDRGPCVDLQIDPDNINWHMGATIALGERAVRDIAQCFDLTVTGRTLAIVNDALKLAEERAAAAEERIAELEGALRVVQGIRPANLGGWPVEAEDLVLEPFKVEPEPEPSRPQAPVRKAAVKK